MTADDLTAYGFGVWYPFTEANEGALLDALPREKGVFAVRRIQSGEKRDIVFVGVAANNYGGLRRRMRDVLDPGPSQSTHQRLHEALARGETLEIAWTVRANGEECTALCDRLLDRYEEEHGHLPEYRLRK